jgi:hypothetical protein
MNSMEQVLTDYSQKNTPKQAHKQTRNKKVLLALAVLFMAAGSAGVFVLSLFVRSFTLKSGPSELVQTENTTKKPLPNGVPSDWILFPSQRCQLTIAMPTQTADAQGNSWFPTEANESWFLFDTTVVATYSKIDSLERDQSMIKIACNENTNRLKTDTLIPALEDAIETVKTTLHPDQLQIINNTTKEKTVE